MMPEAFSRAEQGSGGAQLVAGVPLRRDDAQDLVLVRRAEKTPRLTDDLFQLLARSVRELSREAIGDLLDGRDCLHDRFFGRFRGSGSADRSSYPGSLPDRGSSASLLERAPPRLVVAVPGHRVGKALLERHLRLVAELGSGLFVGQRGGAGVG